MSTLGSQGSIPSRVTRAGLAFGSIAYSRVDYTDLVVGDDVPLFQIHGNVVITAIWGSVVKALTSVSNTGTISLGYTGVPAHFIAATTVDGTNFPENAVWVDTSPTTPIKPLPAEAQAINGKAVDIILQTLVNNGSAGSLDVFCSWYPQQNNGMLTGSGTARQEGG